MKWRVGAWVGAVTVLCLISGCGSSEVKGQVFIVTRGHESIKLGLVDVLLFRESVARKYAAAKLAEILETKASLAQEIDSMQTLLGASQERASAAAVTYDAARRRGDRAEMAKQMGVIRECDAVQRTCMSAFDDYRSRQAALDKQSFVLEGLPEPIARTETDANGEFTLKVPARGRFVLAAQTQREVFGSAETYTWLVLVPDGARKGAKVLLSNETMTTGGSPLSLVHTDR
jgi:hypothetical protein